MKSTFVVSPKKNRTLGIRLAEAEFDEINAFADESGIPLAEMVRRLLAAARQCFIENDGWPREFAVVKKARDGADIQPPATMAPIGSNLPKKDNCSLSSPRADAAAESTTNCTPSPALLGKDKLPHEQGVNPPSEHRLRKKSQKDFNDSVAHSYRKGAPKGEDMVLIPSAALAKTRRNFRKNQARRDARKQ